MRQIKFRGFFDGAMYYPDTTHEYSNVLFHCFSEIAKGEKERKECALMQFTGLTDKNGKEIYEGDILKTPALVTPGYSLGIVEFNADTCCYVKRYGKNPFVRLDVRKDKVEVVTNIYETDKLKHHDRSCSLEAQGYNEDECKEIGDRDYLGSECIELIKKVYG